MTDVQTRESGGNARVTGSASAKPGRSVVQYRLGGRMVDWHSDPRCHVCQSPHRFEIEEGIILGRGYPTIVNSLPEVGRPSIASMRGHLKNHMPADSTVARVILEQRTREIGIAMDAVEGSLVDNWSFYRNVLRRSHENIERSDGSEVSVENGLAAAKALTELEMLGIAGVDQAAYAEAFRIVFTEVRLRMSDAALADLQDALRRNPILKSLLARATGQMEPSEDDQQDERQMIPSAVGV